MCQEAGVIAEQAVMVSDDISSDLFGAFKAGLLTVHVTDYFVPSNLETLVKPDLIVPDLNKFAEQLCSCRRM